MRDRAGARFGAPASVKYVGMSESGEAIHGYDEALATELGEAVVASELRERLLAGEASNDDRRAARVAHSPPTLPSRPGPYARSL